MAQIFKFLTLGLVGCHRTCAGNPFQGLDTGHLVDAHNMTTHPLEQRRIGVERADRFDLLGKRDRILSLRLGVAPIAAAMRLKLGLLLKNAPRSGAKWSAQSGV